MSHLQLDPLQQSIYWVEDSSDLIKVKFDCDGNILKRETVFSQEGIGSFVILQQQPLIWVTDIKDNKLIEVNIKENKSR